MNCEQVQALLSEYWSGTIAVRDHRAVELHFEGCPDCAAESKRLSALWERMDSIPVLSPGPMLRERFYETLDAYRAGMEESLTKPGNSPAGIAARVTRWWRQPVFPFAMAAAALAIGVFAGRSIGRPTGPAPVPAQADQLAQLRGEVSSMRQLVALSLLQQQSASDRLRGVNWSYRVEKTDMEVVNALLGTINNDPNVNVRLSAVDALKRFGASPVVRKGLLQSIGKQESPLVQVGLIDALVDMNDRAAAGPLKQIAAASTFSREVREHAQWAVGQIGQQE